MEKIKFIAAQNEIQRIYSDFGLIVPVGDLDEGHVPSIQPLPSSSTTDSVTASFNIISNADITSLSYTVNDGEAVSVTPQKGVVTITLNDLEYNSGPYTIEITAVNETGSTSAKSTTDLQLYTDWASANEVLAGNKFIAEGEELVGNIPTKTSEDVTVSGLNVTIPSGYFAESATVQSQGVIPTGTLPITENGEGIDVTNYAAVDVAVQSQSANLAAVYYRDDDEEETDNPELDGVVRYSTTTYDPTSRQYVFQFVTEQEFNAAIASCDIRSNAPTTEFAFATAINNGYDGIGSYIICETTTYVYEP